MSDEVVLVPHRRVPVSERGQRLNEAAHRCRYSDEVVAAARALHAAGESYKTISSTLGGISLNTIESWVTFKKRPKPVRFVLKPITT